MKTTIVACADRIALADSNLDEYQRFVASHPDSTIFHHRNWIQLLARYYGLRVQIPCCKTGGQIVAAIPFLETTSLRGKRKLVSLPFTDSLDALASADLYDALKGYLRTEHSEDYDAIVVRTHRECNANGHQSEWVRHTLDTTRTIDEIRAGFDRRVRGNVRRASKHDLSFSISKSAESMRAFYDLQVQTRRRLGVPVQSRRFFEQLRSQIIDADLGFITLVRDGADVVAAGVFLTFNGTLVYKYSAASANAFQHRANDLMTSEAMCWSTLR